MSTHVLRKELSAFGYWRSAIRVAGAVSNFGNFGNFENFPGAGSGRIVPARAGNTALARCRRSACVLDDGQAPKSAHGR
jgi:hypothetical protein